MLYSIYLPIVVLIDYDLTRGIVNQTTLNITSIDRANRRLINVSIYLSAYKLNVYYLVRRLNLILDAFSRFTIPSDDNTRLKIDEPILDAL